MTVETQDSQIVSCTVAGVAIYVVELNRPSTSAANAANAIGFEQHLRGNLCGDFCSVLFLCHAVLLPP
jgi:hypothetical protein